MNKPALSTLTGAAALCLLGAAHAQGAVSTSTFRVGEPQPPRMVPLQDLPQAAQPPAHPAAPATGATPQRTPPAAQPRPGYTPPPATGTGERPQPKAWSASSGGLPPVQEASGVRYVTGGFGLDESSALQKAMADYPVSFVFSRASGEYVAYVPVEIRGSGNAPSVTIKAEGPYLLLDLPRGSYTARATYDGRTLTRQFTVGGGRGHRVGFAW